MAEHKSQIFAAGSALIILMKIFGKQIWKNPTKLLHFLLVEFNPKTTSIKQIAGQIKQISVFYSVATNSIEVLQNLDM